MGLQDSFKKICLKLGENNDAVYAVVAIAVLKGICRPIFTMMDEKEDYETKKYAAIREGLTEVIAIPSYIAIPWAVKKLAGPITRHIPEQAHNAAKTLSFVAVCITALAVIPGLCSLAIKPIMGAFEKKPAENKDTPPAQIDFDKTNLHKPATPATPVFSTFSARHNYGMKVGL